MNKKVIILVMSSRDPFFKTQVKYCKTTYASNLPKNWEFIYYDGNWDDTKLEGDHLKIQCLDNLESTYRKTYLALKYIRTYKDADYVIRLNTSTYLNVPLANHIINSQLINDSSIAGTELYSLSEACAPFPLALYVRGNCMILPKKIINIILDTGMPMLYANIVDDIAIGSVLNSYWISRNENYLDHIVGLPHTWYKSISAKDAKNGHSMGGYGNESINICEKALSIQIKNYINRNTENERFIELHQLMSKAEINTAFWKTYIENPPIFIGSILGYMTFKDWQRMDKNMLYHYEIVNKAADDAESKLVGKRLIDFRTIQGF